MILEPFLTFHILLIFHGSSVICRLITNKFPVFFFFFFFVFFFVFFSDQNFTAASPVSNRMLPFRALCQNDNKVKIVCETIDILKKTCCLIHTHNIGVHGRKINLLALS